MAALPGCHPTWEITPLYAPSTLVSHLTLVNSTTNTHKTYNYQCKSSPLNQYCGQVGYEPGLNGELGAWNLVWTNVGECSGVASTGRPTNAPTKARWSGVGCPKVFDEDEVYAEGEKVKGEDGYVYECKPFPYSGYCGQAGFEPGKVGSAWTEAWTLLGSCSGTIEPTSSPNYDLAAFGGCPNEFDAAVTYEAGDKVAYNGIAFQCKEYPYSAWCSHDSYAPLSTLGKEAWEVLGTCEGTMRPTSSPVFDELVDVDGCPDDFVEGTQYEAGDRVTLPLDGDRGVVYKCPDSWPDSGYCNMIPPGHDSKLGWTLEGSCSGTMRPSTSPVFVSLPDTGGCPREYLASTQYEAGDRASLYLDSDRAVVWECKPYPDSPYCNQYPPNHDSGLGWTMIGSCSGTIIPTASPVFQELTEIGDGCPGIYDSGTLYAKEDYASVVASDDPERVLVYECISAYCNAGSAYKPGGVNSDLGWTLKGYCEGTSQPTSSPAVWTGACTYLNGTTTIQILPWSKSNLATYQGGTRVRKGNRVYQCKPYPYYLWCRMAVYEPEKNIFYSDAWTRTGSC